MNERVSLKQTVGISQEEVLAQDLASLEQKNPAAAESIKKAEERRSLFCDDGCKGKMPHAFATHKEKRYCSQECLNKAVAKDRQLRGQFEEDY